MRVALIVDEPYETGIGKYAKNLHMELRALGIGADLFRIRWSTQRTDTPSHDGEMIRPAPFSIPFRSLEAVLAGYRRDSLFPNDYDLYHVAQQFLIPILPSFGAGIATIHDLKPLVIPGHYPYLLRRTLKGIAKRTRELRTVITDSVSTKRDVTTLLGVREESVQVIPLGKGDEFKPHTPDRISLGLPERPRIIMNVGTEDSSKNIPFLLDVLREVRQRMEDVILLRIGKRGRTADRLIRALGLEQNVIYVNGLSDDTLSQYYSSVDLLAHPSLYEGFGLPPLEAMASGCPVVCSDGSSLNEVAGEAGVLLPLERSRWVDEIIRLLNSDSELEDLRRRGIRRASGFTWKRCAEQTASAYGVARRAGI